MCKECPECGYIFDDPTADLCPKCDTPRHESREGECLYYEADIAHHGEDWLEAQRKIDDAIDRALYEGFKGVKIIHGHGGFGHTSIIKSKAVPYLNRYARKHGYKLVQDKFNDGAHIVYFNV
jgi:DNA-nicking Smr family endonuclease